MKNLFHHQLARLGMGLLACAFVGAVGTWQRDRVGKVFPSLGTALQALHDTFLPASTSSSNSRSPSNKVASTSGETPPPSAFSGRIEDKGKVNANDSAESHMGIHATQADPNAARKTPAQMRLRGEAITRLKHNKKALGEAFLDLAADLTRDNWVETFEGVASIYGKGLLPPNA